MTTGSNVFIISHKERQLPAIKRTDSGVSVKVSLGTLLVLICTILMIMIILYKRAQNKLRSKEHIMFDFAYTALAGHFGLIP